MLTREVWLRLKLLLADVPWDMVGGGLIVLENPRDAPRALAALGRAGLAPSYVGDGMVTLPEDWADRLGPDRQTRSA